MFSSSSPSTGKLDPHVEMNGTSSDTLALHQVAMDNYEKFNGLPKGCCTFEQVVASSAGVLGWAQFTGPAIKFEVPPISNSVPLKDIQHRRKAKKEMKAKNKSLTTEQGQDEFGIPIFATAASKASQDNSLTISENVQCEHKDFEDKCSVPFRGNEQNPTLLPDLPDSSYTKPQLRGGGGMMDPEMEAAMAASLADDHALEKEELANEMLAQLNPIQPSEGNPFRLRQDQVDGDGFCCCRCIAAQANLSNVDDVDVRLLAACAFAQVALTVPRHFIDDTRAGIAERRN